jgi:hypothetical protein
MKTADLHEGGEAAMDGDEKVVAFPVKMAVGRLRKREACHNGIRPERMVLAEIGSCQGMSKVVKPGAFWPRCSKSEFRIRKQNESRRDDSQ